MSAPSCWGSSPPPTLASAPREPQPLLCITIKQPPHLWTGFTHSLVLAQGAASTDGCAHENSELPSSTQHVDTTPEEGAALHGAAYEVSKIDAAYMRAASSAALATPRLLYMTVVLIQRVFDGCQVAAQACSHDLRQRYRCEVRSGSPASFNYKCSESTHKGANHQC
jgi:hypothetical protein